MSYENIRLEKGMYREAGRSFLQVLESLDPSENYRGTALEGTDAFQRQLRRFEIRAKGAYSDPVEKFFRSSDAAVLFPEYIARSVRAGMEEGDILPKLIAATTTIDAMDYRSIYADGTESDRTLAAVAEGAQIPTTTIRSKSNLVRLHKRGRMLVASYEAIRFQKLDLFAVTLRQIGRQIQTMHLSDAIGVLISGDGNDNAAASYAVGGTGIGGTAGTLSYDALVRFWSKLEPYTATTFLASPSTMVDILSLSEFKNPLTGLNFQGSGVPGTPLGAELLRTGKMADGQILALDRRYCLEMVQAGEVSVEYDKLIDRQLERAAITSTSGFGKICKDAAILLTV